jgi:hypothetical protein
MPANPGAPEIASYAIAAALDPEARRLEAVQRLTYHNAYSRPINELVLHLYLNAFRSLDTVFMEESGGALRGYEFTPENAGWIEVTSITLAGEPLELELLEDGTLASARLPQPVAPGEALVVDMTFTAQLPQVFARTGWALDEQGDPFFLVAQWFPKAGVWTDEGWVADVFHGNAEFFADFGSYQVTLTLPEGWAHGATGIPAEAGPAEQPEGWQTVTYLAAGVIDFAWVTSPNLQSAVRDAGGVELRYLYLPEHDWTVERILPAVESSLERFSAWFGAYPYPRLTIVDVPEEGSGAGGMEYPTFITVGGGYGSPDGDLGGWGDFMEIVAVHETAHQWWQSMVATNEAREPWLDEGFADYATVRFMIDRYGLDSESGFFEGRRNAFLRAPDVPMLGPAWEFSYGEYVAAAYAKPIMALLTLERQVGEETMLRILRAYFERYRFAQPTTADFRAVAEEVSGQPLDWFFDGLVTGEETINYTVRQVGQDTVVVEREGDLELPVEVAVTLSGGGAEDGEALAVCPGPGEEAVCTLRYPGKTVQSVTLDPERKLLIETDWEDNTWP